MWKAGCFYLHGMRWYKPNPDLIGRWLFLEEVPPPPPVEEEEEEEEEEEGDNNNIL